MRIISSSNHCRRIHTRRGHRFFLTFIFLRRAPKPPVKPSCRSIDRATLKPTKPFYTESRTFLAQVPPQNDFRWQTNSPVQVPQLVFQLSFSNEEFERYHAVSQTISAVVGNTNLRDDRLDHALGTLIDAVFYLPSHKKWPVSLVPPNLIHRHPQIRRFHKVTKLTLKISYGGEANSDII
jgi:hypothetical protein